MNVHYVLKIVKNVHQISVLHVSLDIFCQQILVLQIVVNVIMQTKNIRYVNHAMMDVQNVLEQVLINVYFVNLLIYFQITDVYHIVHINIFIISFLLNVNIVMITFTRINVLLNVHYNTTLLIIFVNYVLMIAQVVNQVSICTKILVYPIVLLVHLIKMVFVNHAIYNAIHVNFNLINANYVQV